MISYLYLLIGFSVGCIWMGISFLTAYWWCNSINRMEDAETGTEFTRFDRAREDFDRNSI